MRLERSSSLGADEAQVRSTAARRHRSHRTAEFWDQRQGSLILDTLRSKLYDDPMKAMCREIMANARDAHREAGTPDLPIEVTLPTAFSRSVEIRDQGTGISPRRMSEIFLNYGASTKRREGAR